MERFEVEAVLRRLSSFMPKPTDRMSDGMSRSSKITATGTTVNSNCMRRLAVKYFQN